MKKSYPNHSWMLVIPGILIVLGIVSTSGTLVYNHPILGTTLFVTGIAALVFVLLNRKKNKIDSDELPPKV